MAQKTKEQETQKKQYTAREKKHSTSLKNTDDSTIKTHDFAADARRILHEQDLSRKASPRLYPAMPIRIFEDTPLSEEPDEMEMNIKEQLKTVQKPYRDDREVGRMPLASDHTKRGLTTAGRGKDQKVERQKSFVRARPVFQERSPAIGTADLGMRSEGVHGGCRKRGTIE